MKPEPDRLLTVEEAAEAFNTGTRFVRQLIAERRIWYTHLGRHVRIPESASVRDVRDFAGELGIHSDFSAGVLDGQ